MGLQIIIGLMVFLYMMQLKKQSKRGTTFIQSREKDDMALSHDAFLQEAKDSIKASLISTITYTLTSSWMFLIGMMAAMMTGESDIAQIMLRLVLAFQHSLSLFFQPLQPPSSMPSLPVFHFSRLFLKLMDVLFVCWSLLLEHFVLLSFQWMILPISFISLVQSFPQ